MEVYIYQAALYCEDCGIGIIDALTKQGKAPEDHPEDDSSYDSDDFPKGPVADGGGEADGPQHCDACGVFLENGLTRDGEDYVTAVIREDRKAGRLDSVALTEWAPFYDIT